MKTSFWTRLLDVVSPRPCAICGTRLSPAESVLCAACHLHLPLTHYESSPLDNPMARLFWGLFPVERAAALFFYEPKSPLSRLIYDIKYNGHPELGEDMGRMAARQFAAAGFFDGMDAIVPMPITRRRQWQRGYNQSHAIAQGISRQTGLPIVRHAVRRTRFTASQTAMHTWERRQNVEEAFRLVDPDRIAGMHVLLVDDIVTTGATVTACARQLAMAPGVRISILTLGITR